MTLMDKIRGWKDEERWVGSTFAACMWIYTKEARTEAQILGPEQKEYSKKRRLSIMTCRTGYVLVLSLIMNGSERTIQHEEEIFGLELNCKIMSHVRCNGV